MPKTYGVNELSQIMKIDPQTIRRWVRNGRLRATIGSRKQGYGITKEDLDDFLLKNPKYRVYFIEKRRPDFSELYKAKLFAIDRAEMLIRLKAMAEEINYLIEKLES